VTPYDFKPAIKFSPRENIRHDLLQEIPFYRISREITMFRKAFQEFLSGIKNFQYKPPTSVS
jgi:hypothetical protein